MKIQKFEDIIAWRKAQELAVELYSLLNRLKDLGFKSQILRAVVSISSNIAEGFDRSSDADFARFLYISLGSCSETKSMLYLAESLGYIAPERSKLLLNQVNEISKMTRGLIKSLKNHQ